MLPERRLFEISPCHPHKLGVPETLRRSLRGTNAISESLYGLMLR